MAIHDAASREVNLIATETNEPETIALCAPDLGLRTLLILRTCRQRRPFTLYYDKFPRYVRGVIKLLRLREATVEKLCSVLAGASIQKIKHGDTVPDYPLVFLRSMEISSRIADELISELGQDEWMELLSRLVGTSPANAFATKHLAYAVVWQHVLALTACSASLGGKVDLTVLWHADWLTPWRDVVKRNIPDARFTFFKWPAGYVAVHQAFLKYSLLVKLLAASLGRVCHQTQRCTLR